MNRLVTTKKNNSKTKQQTKLHLKSYNPRNRAQKKAEYWLRVKLSSNKLKTVSESNFVCEEVQRCRHLYFHSEPDKPLIKQLIKPRLVNGCNQSFITLPPFGL